MLRGYLVRGTWQAPPNRAAQAERYPHEDAARPYSTGDMAAMRPLSARERPQRCREGFPPEAPPMPWLSYPAPLDMQSLALM